MFSAAPAFDMEQYIPPHLSCTNSVPKEDLTEKGTSDAGSKEFKSIGSLKHHEPYKCQLCGTSFVAKSKLTIHYRKHTGETPYKCEICESSFTRKDRLTRHLRSHMEEKLYKCEICGISFARNDRLTRHLKGHMGEKPYGCMICGNCFTRKDGLTRHLRTHTTEEVHKYNICGNSYIEENMSTYHLREDTEEKPYKCEICGNWYYDKCIMTNHNLIGEQVRKCDTCNKGFAQQGTLLNYIKGCENVMHVGNTNEKVPLEYMKQEEVDIKQEQRDMITQEQLHMPHDEIYIKQEQDNEESGLIQTQIFFPVKIKEEVIEGS